MAFKDTIFLDFDRTFANDDIGGEIQPGFLKASSTELDYLVDLIKTEAQPEKDQHQNSMALSKKQSMPRIPPYPQESLLDTKTTKFVINNKNGLFKISTRSLSPNKQRE